MQQLHLVGFTTDHKGLILGTRRGTEEGGYVVTLDRTFVEHIEELLRLQAGEETPGSTRRAGPNGAVPLLRKPRTESKITPREVQAMLRTGRSLSEVADAAGMSEEWVGRYAAPVLAEQARVVERATASTYVKPRIGPSIQALGDSVVWNLAERGIVLKDAALEDAWTAFQPTDGGWVVRVSYLSERRRQHADWAVDMAQGALKAVNRLANELAYVEPGRRRPPALPPPAPVPASAQRAAAAPRPVPSPGPQARASGRLSLLGGSPSARPASTPRPVEGSGQRPSPRPGSAQRLAPPPSESAPPASADRPRRTQPPESPRRDDSTTVISTNPAPRVPPSRTGENGGAGADESETRGSARRRSSRDEVASKGPSTEARGSRPSGGQRLSRAERLARAGESERPLRPPDRRPRGGPPEGSDSLPARADGGRSAGGDGGASAEERPGSPRPQWEERLLEEKRRLRAGGLPVYEGPPSSDRPEEQARSPQPEVGEPAVSPKEDAAQAHRARAREVEANAAELRRARARAVEADAAEVRRARALRAEAEADTAARAASPTRPADRPEGAERLVRADPERPVHADPERPVQADRERPVQADRERPVQADRERPLRADRPLRSEPEAGAERPLRADRPLRREGAPTPDRPLRAERPPYAERPLRADRPLRSDTDAGGERPLRADRPLRPEGAPTSDRPLRAERTTRPDPARGARLLQANRRPDGDAPSRADRPLRSARPIGAERPVRAERTERAVADDPTDMSSPPGPGAAPPVVAPASEAAMQPQEWTGRPPPARGEAPELRSDPPLRWSAQKDDAGASGYGLRDGPITAPVPAVELFGPDGEATGGSTTDHDSGANAVVIRAGQAAPEAEAARSGRRAKTNEAQPGRSGRLFLRRKSQDSR